MICWRGAAANSYAALEILYDVGSNPEAETQASDVFRRKEGLQEAGLDFTIRETLKAIVEMNGYEVVPAMLISTSSIRRVMRDLATLCTAGSKGPRRRRCWMFLWVGSSRSNTCLVFLACP